MTLLHRFENPEWAWVIWRDGETYHQFTRALRHGDAVVRWTRGPVLSRFRSPEGSFTVFAAENGMRDAIPVGEGGGAWGLALTDPLALMTVWVL